MRPASRTQRDRRLVDATLRRFLPRPGSVPVTVRRAMAYSLFPGGKRLRPILAIATEGDAAIGRLDMHVITIPAAVPRVQPALTVLPLQLLAYYVADGRGLNVDQPRNLAKSVTVE